MELKDEKPFYKKYMLGIIGIIIFTIGGLFSFLGFMYQEGIRAEECTDKFDSWDGWSMEQLHEALISGSCDGFIDFKKTRELNPDIFNEYDNWRKSNLP